MVLLILLIFLLLTIKEGTVRFSNVIYSIVFGVATLWVITEVLSLFSCITVAGLLVSWGAIDAVVLFFTLRLLHRRSRLCLSVFKPDKQIALMSVPLVVLAVVSLLLAIISIPINYDSMTYHLSRVAHWANNQSVAYYATHSLRQLTSPMLSEYVMLHYYVLLGKNDALVNLVQAISYCISACVIWDIAKKVGVNSLFRFVSSIVFMTTPIVFAESFTTQNDLFATMWLLIFVDIVIDYLQEKKVLINYDTVFDIVVMSICIAFGYLSKPNVCIAMAFFVIWLFVKCLRRKDAMIEIMKGILIASITILLFIMPYFTRNYMMMGRFTAYITGAKQLVGTTNPKYLLVNFIKNYSFNFPNIIDTDSPQKIYDIVNKIADFLNVKINDPSISEEGGAFFVHASTEKGMDTAVNPLFSVLFTFVVLPGILIGFLKRDLSLKVMYATTSAVAFLFFLFALRWEPYISRYMVGFMALLSVAIGAFLEEALKKLNKYLVYATITILFVGCVTEYYSTIQAIKSLFNIYDTREECYFTLDRVYYDYYKIAADCVTQNGYRKVGILSAENYYDYPFYKMIEKNIDQYKHVNVKIGDYIFNDSYKYEDKSYQPDFIFVIANQMNDESYYEYNGNMYRVELLEPEGWISLLIRADEE